MKELTKELIAVLRKSGPKRFANWSDEAFDSYVTGPIEALERSLSWNQDEQPDLDTMSSFTHLIFEGIGAGWLGVSKYGVTPRTFLAHCLGTLIPYKLRELPRNQRGDVLQTIWNLGEGMAREPQWLNQYAIAKTDWSTDLADLSGHLKTILAPVLAPVADAEWNGRYRLRILDLSREDESFVPGKLYLAAPAVVCVENRIGNDETIGVLLQQRQEPEVLGSVGRLPEYAESFEEPDVELNEDAVVINGKSISAPLITSPRQPLCVASGYVIVSAEDSQRLWLVEAA